MPTGGATSRFAPERRVLQVLRTAGVSGAENHLALLIEHLPPHGWVSDVLIAAPDPTALRTYAERLARQGGRVRLIRMEPDVSPRLLLHLIRALAGSRYDVVHTHLVHADWHAGLASLIASSAPLVTTKHNHDPFRTRRSFRTGERLWLQRCTASIAISDSLAEFVERWSGIRPQTVRYGWPADHAPPHERRFARELLAVGRLEPQKAFDVLVEAVALIRDEGLDVRLRIAGEGSQRGRLQELIDDRRLGGSATLLGQRKDVPALMAAADVFVHTARWEGFGLVLLEAMSAALPVVATNVGAIPEVIVDGATGLLVPPGDPVGLARALRRLAEDPALSAALGLAGHHRLATVFTPEQMAARTAEVYDQALMAS